MSETHKQEDDFGSSTISFPTMHVSLPVPQPVIHIQGRKSTGKGGF
jgi:hypothetical protein